MDINKLLQVACQRSASFIYLNLNSPPALRVGSEIINMQTANINSEDMDNLIGGFLDEEQRKIYESSGRFCLVKDIDESFKAYISLFKDRQGPAAFFKIMSNKILNLDDLPPAVWSMEPGLYSGLVVIAGLAGAGKSSTLAAIVNRFNEQHCYRILTIEDKIVFRHDSKKSLVNQLEVNPESLQDALKFALQGNYNIVAIDAACGMAELDLVLDIAKKVNILIFLVMNARSIQSVITNLINADHGNYSLSCLSCAEAIEAVLLQTLVAKQDSNGGMAGAFELMIASPAIRKLIEEGKLQQILSLVQVGASYGMCTMKNSLQSLVKNGVISSKIAHLTANVFNRHENKGPAKIPTKHSNNDSDAF